MRTKCMIALITMAAVCILMAPAFSMPFDRSAPGSGHPGMMFLPNNMTKEEMNNMTLGELHEIMQDSRANETCHFKNSGREMGDEGCPRMGQSGFMGNASPEGRLGRGHKSQGSPMLLILDDLTAEDLSNMTLSQIERLKQQKMGELYNMTPNEINALKKSKMQEQNNMTLGEVQAQSHELIQVARLLGFDGTNDRAKDMRCNGMERCGFGRMNQDEEPSQR